MAPPLLTLKDIHLTFGGTPLLEGAELTVAARDRICLVGRNGSGKSTLLKIAAGLVEPDRGERFAHPGASIRYLPQEADFAGFNTVRAYVEAGLGPADNPFAAEHLISDLGLSGDDDPERLSGGEARGVALARVLVAKPDVLLLDEPTNHLDLTAIEWLEATLQASRSALLLISHDRRFLENLSRATVWLDRGQTRRLEQGFAAFEDWRDKIFEEEETERHKLDRKIVREDQWMHGGVTGRRKRNVRRVRELRALREQVREQRRAAGSVRLDAAEGGLSGKLVVEMTDVAKGYGGDDIISGLSLRVMRGDRLGIVGPNGIGKTTLLKLLTGEIAADRGAIRHGVNLEVVSLDQRRDELNPNWTVSDALTGRTRRPGHHQWQGAPRRELHEGFSVSSGAAAIADPRALWRRAGEADACQGAGQAIEPVGPRRADERPRSRNTRSLAGAAIGLSRDAAAGQPRSRFSRPDRHQCLSTDRWWPLDRVRRRLFRYARAAPGRGPAKERRAGGSVAGSQSCGR